MRGCNYCNIGLNRLHNASLKNNFRHCPMCGKNLKGPKEITKYKVDQEKLDKLWDMHYACVSDKSYYKLISKDNEMNYFIVINPIGTTKQFLIVAEKDDIKQESVGCDIESIVPIEDIQNEINRLISEGIIYES